MPMSNELIIQELESLAANILNSVTSKWPAIQQASKNYYKTQSQFMDSMLTVSHPTPLRNLRQILAEINKSKMALDEAYFGISKKKIEIKRKNLLLTTAAGLDAELLELEIKELESQISNSMNYVEGAIRKISAYMAQYENILIVHGIDKPTEEDFESDEERYHIMKMCEQALCAARAHGGSVDEGNQIYAHQIGINGTVLQEEISSYLRLEQKLLKEGKEPTHKMTINWLSSMADKYHGSAGKYAEHKGMKLVDQDSLIK